MADSHGRAVRLVEWLLTPSVPVIVLGLLVVLLFPIFLHFFLARKTAYVTLPSVLVVGPSGAGKTAFLTYLERGAAPSSEKRETGPPPTHTSQTPNVVELAVSADGASSFRDDLDAAGAVAKKFLLVDTPGHGKLRATTLARLASGTGLGTTSPSKLKAVVFMLDAGALTADEESEGGTTAGGSGGGGGANLAATAAYLYDVLLALQKRMSAGTRSSKAPPAIPVLIAANKADLFTALPAPLVKTHLEAELGRIRATRSRGLLASHVGTDDAADSLLSDENDDWLGAYGTDRFAFDQLREFDTDVDVVGGNLVGADGPGVDKWWSWIADKI